MSHGYPSRLVVYLDLDGTLLTSELTVSVQARGILQIAESVAEVVLCSGRPLKACLSLAHDLLSAPKYIIASNGGVIYECEADRVIHGTYLDREVAREVVVIARSSGAAVCVYHPLTWYAARQDRAVLLEASRSGAMPIWADDVDEALEGAVKLMLVTDPGLVPALQARLRSADLPVYSFTSYPEYVEVMPVGSDKGVAARLIGELLSGMHPVVSVGIGDGPADVALFDAVDVSVAVANGHEELLARASYIAPSNDNDGAAIAIAAVVLQEGWAISQLRPAQR